jgi:hypothetical protein
MMIAATISKIPINAGKPLTEPLNFTAQAAMESPASMLAVPFHFDHREARPRTNKTAEVMNSLCSRMGRYFA